MMNINAGSRRKSTMESDISVDVNQSNPQKSIRAELGPIEKSPQRLAREKRKLQHQQQLQQQQQPPSFLELTASFLSNLFFQEEVHQKTIEINRKNRERERLQKETKIKNEKDSLGSVWIEEIIPNWEEAKKGQQIKSLLEKEGIPISVRGKVWQRAIGNSLNIKDSDFPKLLQEVERLRKEHARMTDENVITTKQSPFRLIEVDVPRTFISTELFLKNGPYYEHLTTVLSLFAINTPHVGYVQGMSYLAGTLLLYNDVLTSFICLSNLLNNDFLRSMFKMDIERVLRHLKVFDLLFKFNLPKTYERFVEIGISHEQYLLDWFMTIFSKTLSIPIVSRIWDNYLIFGEVFLFRVALGIIYANRVFLTSANFEECVLSLRSLGLSISEEKLFAAIAGIEVPPYVYDFIEKLNNNADDQGTQSVLIYHQIRLT